MTKSFNLDDTLDSIAPAIRVPIPVIDSSQLWYGVDNAMSLINNTKRITVAAFTPQAKTMFFTHSRAWSEVARQLPMNTTKNK